MQHTTTFKLRDSKQDVAQVSLCTVVAETTTELLFF